MGELRPIAVTVKPNCQTLRDHTRGCGTPSNTTLVKRLITYPEKVWAEKLRAFREEAEFSVIM